MAILGSTYWNLIDALKAQDLNAEAAVAEVLHQFTPFLKDANVQSCNKGTKHAISIRSGLPSVSWGALYQGIAQSKGNYTTVEETTGFVEGLSSVDTRLLGLYPNETGKLRLMEAQGFIEAIAQALSSAIWYSDVRTSPTQFHGMAPRYNSLANKNVINGGGSGSDNMSIWFVTHGDMQTSMLTPQSIAAGLRREDKGEQRVLDGNGNPYYVKEEMFCQHAGIGVKDWRWNTRIANIDVSDVVAGTVVLNPLLRKAYHKLQGTHAYQMDKPGVAAPGRTVIYMNRTAFEALDAESTNSRATDNFIRLTPMEIQGEEVQTWRGIPIRRDDTLVETETLVA
ncbi:hypothetical protein FHW96_000285 [Novosphingobium sp. SG751A]|uniref:major capsid protein n=1 Tax=Novosphingobium sp. SG751A TaxID=2587000 RepID=UPI001551B733|nr:hypothetical protein [Novosphingobium sp. SG751A]NOW44158.1 hypothetical protein [Novosphingobium sp. SG751A]